MILVHRVGVVDSYGRSAWDDRHSIVFDFSIKGQSNRSLGSFRGDSESCERGGCNRDVRGCRRDTNPKGLGQGGCGKDHAVEDIFTWVGPVAVEVKVDPSIEQAGGRQRHGQLGIDVLVEHRSLVGRKGVGLESERHAVVVFISIACGLRLAFALGRDSRSELQSRVAHDVPSTIVCLEGWVSAQSGCERIRSVAVVEFDSWHNDRELRLVVDAIALEEVSCVVLDSSEVEAAEFRADAHSILDKESRTTTNLSDQRGTAGCRESVDRTDDRIAHVDRAERWVLDEHHRNRSARNTRATQRRSVVDVRQVPGCVEEFESPAGDLGIEV